MAEQPGQITQLLVLARGGDRAAECALMDLVYNELRQIAARYVRKERRDNAFRPTDLVHEAYAKLAGEHRPELHNRSHFYAVASNVMRRILMDYARAQSSAKRGGGRMRVQAGEFLLAGSVPLEMVVYVGEALDELAKFDSRQCAIVEMRFFGGLTDEEIARVLGISSRTVKRDWSIAKAWLYSRLQGK